MESGVYMNQLDWLFRRFVFTDAVLETSGTSKSEHVHHCVGGRILENYYLSSHLVMNN